jgi:hypothetical protein
MESENQIIKLKSSWRQGLVESIGGFPQGIGNILDSLRSGNAVSLSSDSSISAVFHDHTFVAFLPQSSAAVMGAVEPSGMLMRL